MNFFLHGLYFAATIANLRETHEATGLFFTLHLSRNLRLQTSIFKTGQDTVHSSDPDCLNSQLLTETQSWDNCGESKDWNSSPYTTRTHNTTTNLINILL